MKAIAWSAPLPFVTCTFFTLLCARLNLHSYSATFKLALAIWLVGPLPLLIVNGLFIKLHSAITAAYSIGWLVKLSVAAAAVALILPLIRGIEIQILVAATAEYAKLHSSLASLTWHPTQPKMCGE